MIFTIGLLLICISIYLTYRVWNKEKEIVKINEKVKEQNEEIEKENEKLVLNKNELEKQVLEQTAKLQGITQAIQNSQDASDQSMIACAKAFNNYMEVLENNYKQTGEEYDKLVKSLMNSYDKVQDKIILAIEKEKTELDKYKNTRIAAIQANLKEQEIKEKLEFYCLHPTETENDDIQELERAKSRLHQPRILSMLIWSTYHQKPMTTLCNNILGTSIICGIYKITNQKTNMCYIGQAADIAKRWKDHAKCWLGIDTPANNKLYKAMQEDGIWNFSWELIETCPRDLLNEKEAFYIDLYNSCAYGYNSNSGIKKS